MGKYDLENMTGSGCLLVLITAVLTLGVGIPVLKRFWESLPPGEYPQILFVGIIVGIGLGIFGMGSVVVNLMGKKVYRDDIEPSQGDENRLEEHPEEKED